MTRLSGEIMWPSPGGLCPPEQAGQELKGKVGGLVNGLCLQRGAEMDRDLEVTHPDLPRGGKL